MNMMIGVLGMAQHGYHSLFWDSYTQHEWYFFTLHNSTAEPLAQPLHIASHDVH